MRKPVPDCIQIRAMMFLMVVVAVVTTACAGSAWAEVVNARSGEAIPVLLVPNESRQIVFPLPLNTIEKRKDSGLTVRVPAGAKDMIVVDAASLPAPMDVYVTDVQGNRFLLRFEMTNQPQDAMVLVRSSSSNMARSEAIVKNTPLTALLIAMASDRRLDGFSVRTLRKPKRIYWRDGLAVYVHRIYTSAQWTGYVTTIENTNPVPVAFDVREFNYDGLVAIGAKRSLLAPRPKLATDYLAGRYRTRMEFVVDTTKDPDQLGPLQ